MRRPDRALILALLALNLMLIALLAGDIARSVGRIVEAVG